MNFFNKIKDNPAILVLPVFGIMTIGLMVYFYEPWAPRKETPLPNSISSQVLLVGSTTTGYQPNTAAVLPPKKKTQQEQVARLGSRLPYQGDGFVIKFNYQENKFAVSSLSVENTTYKQQFLEWLKQSEYSAIPLSSFGF